MKNFNPYPSYTAAGRFINGLNRVARDTQAGSPGPLLPFSLSDLFEGVADYFWRAPRVGQAMLGPDGTRHIVVAARGAREGGESYTMVAEDDLRGDDCRLVETKIRTRAEMKEYKPVPGGATVAGPDDAAFRYAQGTQLDASFLSSYNRTGGTGLGLSATAVRGAGTLGDGTQYYILDHFLYRTAIACPRAVLDGDPAVKKWRPAATPPAP